MQNKISRPYKKIIVLTSCALVALVTMIMIQHEAKQQPVPMAAEWAKTTHQLYLPIPPVSVINRISIPLYVESVDKRIGDFIPYGLQWFSLDTKPLQIIIEEADYLLEPAFSTSSPYNTSDNLAIYSDQPNKLNRPSTNLEIEASQIMLKQYKATLQHLEIEITRKEKSIAHLSQETAKLQLAHHSFLAKYHQKKETLENLEEKLEELENSKTHMEQLRKEHEALVEKRLHFSKLIHQTEQALMQSQPTTYQQNTNVTDIIRAKRAYALQILSYVRNGAPSNGYLQHIAIKPNTELDPANPIATLVAPDIPLRLVLQAPEKIAASLTNGPCLIAFEHSPNHQIEGTITAILPPEQPSDNVRVIVNLEPNDTWQDVISYESLIQVFEIRLIQNQKGKWF